MIAITTVATLIHQSHCFTEAKVVILDAICNISLFVKEMKNTLMIIKNENSVLYCGILLRFTLYRHPKCKK